VNNLCITAAAASCLIFARSHQCGDMEPHCGECAQRICRMLYKSYARSFVHEHYAGKPCQRLPGIALLGNAGLAAYQSWTPTLAFLSEHAVRCQRHIGAACDVQAHVRLHCTQVSAQTGAGTMVVSVNAPFDGCPVGAQYSDGLLQRGGASCAAVCAAGWLAVQPSVCQSFPLALEARAAG
jgi:hypothetical protein